MINVKNNSMYLSKHWCVGHVDATPLFSKLLNTLVLKSLSIKIITLCVSSCYSYGCSHNPMSQKGCWTTKKNSQNWINIYVLPFKPMQSWQVVFLFIIWMLRNSNQKSIWWNFKFKFWFKTFESEHLWH